MPLKVTTRLDQSRGIIKLIAVSLAVIGIFAAAGFASGERHSSQSSIEGTYHTITLPPFDLNTAAEDPNQCLAEAAAYAAALADLEIAQEVCDQMYEEYRACRGLPPMPEPPPPVPPMP